MKIQVDKTSVEVPRIQSANLHDIVGNRYGKLVVISRAENSKFNQTVWLCKCECGNEKEVVARNLKIGKTRSCGCLAKEKSDRLRSERGEHYGRLYNVWNSMKGRCTRKKFIEYSRYGGRGITLCEEWLDVSNFIKWSLVSGWEPGLQIDRIDNDKGYSPDNCRFVTHLENQHNKSRLKRNNTTGFSGVSFHRGCKKFYARVAHKSFGIKCLGLHNTPEEAAEARDRFIIANNLPHKLQILKRP